MNKINFNQTGGFPLDTDILNFMQSSYDLFNSLGEVAGNLAILRGCEVTGNSVANGVVYIAGEVLPFRGATASERVVIREEKRSLPFEDGESKEVEITRYATFGNGTTTYPWADFKRFHNLQELKKLVFDEENSVEKRLRKLEERVTKTIPIGLVAIWDRPADQIPQGWVEHTELQGYTPVGQKQNDADFGQLGRTLGTKTHKLTIAEMPRHKHKQGSEALHNRYGGGRLVGTRTYLEGTHQTFEDANTSEEGNDQAHNNIQPSRIVRFIRFVGF
ncbi:MAG: hypothetical protein Q4C98_10460 [Capnocytophaga sp.]|nr:hypothetical protein [Capnocytophaga sp.]